MPRGDGTGPMGMGPMTGRAAGYCAGYDAPGYANPAPGGGRGWFGRGGRGGRGGWGRRNVFRATGLTGWQRAAMGMQAWGAPPAGAPYAAAPSKEEELEVLKAQAQNMEGSLEDIRKRIQDLESEE